MSAPAGSYAPAVSRALRVLALLEAAGGGTLGVSEMARQLGVARSSLHNVCLALEAEGVVQRSESGYRLGRRLVELGGAYLRTVDPVQAFYQACSDTSFLHNEICQLAVLDGTDVLYLAAHAGRLPLRMTASIGSRFPASITAVGNALLAQLDDDELRQRFEDPATRPAWTASSVTDLEALIDKIGDVRGRGHALDAGEVFPGIRGLAVAVAPQYSGEQAYAVGASLLEVYCNAHIEQQAIEALSAMAAHIANPMNLGRGSAGVDA